MHLFLIFCESAISRRYLRTKNHASLQLISDKIQIIRFYLSLVRSVAYRESEVKLFACKEITNRWQFSFSKGEKWYDKLFNVKFLPLFHHFKAIYQFPKHIIFLVKIVANASLRSFWELYMFKCNETFLTKFRKSWYTCMIHLFCVFSLCCQHLFI
jgi:hypothetical protein